METRNDFKGRFIDDLLCIVDVTDFDVEIEEWLVNPFQHCFFKFTYEFSFESINFLDFKLVLTKIMKSSPQYIQKKFLSKSIYIFHQIIQFI